MKIEQKSDVGAAQEVANPNESLEIEDGSAFSTALDGVLRSHNPEALSEEELFSGLVGKQLVDRQLLSVADWQQRLSEQLPGDSGYMALEDAAKGVLGELLDAEQLTGQEANTIYSRAFAAAQLDNNSEYLFDHKGGEGDNTLATAEKATAVNQGLAALELFSSSEDTPVERSVRETTPTISHILGSYGIPEPSAHTDPTDLSLNGFVYKPESESDGKLVVLAPYEFTGNITTVNLVRDGEVIEEGRFTGIANGNRSHFRFNRPGSNYPDDLTVQFVMDSGAIEEFLVRDSSERKEA